VTEMLKKRLWCKLGFWQDVHFLCAL